MARTSKMFIKNKENFNCEKCGYAIVGNGYTNHCPSCLWSKHVDVHPGDRACLCHGLMMPIGVMMVSGEPVLVHECVACKFRKNNKVTTEDSVEMIMVLAAKVIREEI